MDDYGFSCNELREQLAAALARAERAEAALAAVPIKEISHVTDWSDSSEIDVMTEWLRSLPELKAE